MSGENTNINLALDKKEIVDSKPHSHEGGCCGRHNHSSVNNNLEKPMSLKEWIMILFITAIPVVGFIFLVIWAFDKSITETKRNYARAALIFMVIGGILFGFFGLVALIFRFFWYFGGIPY